MLEFERFPWFTCIFSILGLLLNAGHITRYYAKSWKKIEQCSQRKFFFLWNGLIELVKLTFSLIVVGFMYTVVPNFLHTLTIFYWQQFFQICHISNNLLSLPKLAIFSGGIYKLVLKQNPEKVNNPFPTIFTDDGKLFHRQ